MDKISVIIPVYKVKESYLRQCIQSIIQQTYQNIEIILVDDGSPDQCGGICEEFAARDNRIFVVHQENQGVSAARNRGIHVASGTWICFVDADDWMEKDSFSQVMECIKGQVLDWVVWNMCLNSMDNERISENYSESIIINDKNKIDELKLRLLRTISNGKDKLNITNLSYLWSRLYRRDIIEKYRIRFEIDFKQGEDKLFNYQYLSHVDSMMYLNLPLYHYRLHQQSVSHSFYSQHVDNTTRILNKYYEIEPKIKTDDRYRNTYNIRVAYLAWWLIGKYYLHEDSTVEKPVKSFKAMMQSEPYKRAVKELDTSELIRPLTKIRLILLKYHMYHLLFLDTWIEKKWRNR